jgi:cytochrome c biogenesis factor
MSIDFKHVPHPHIANRKKSGPPKTTDEHVGPNGKIALVLTTVVGTMWCAYAFAALAFVALPSAIKDGSVLALIQWISQTFIQLVMLSVIMVGQNILGRASDKRAEMTYKDADATFHEAEQIQAHLLEQDAAINAMLDKIIKLEAALVAKK